MKKSLLFVLLLAVFCSYFTSAFAEDLQPSELTVYNVARAFYWGTDYNTVLDFASQVPGFELERQSTSITIKKTDHYSAPEVYTFEFSDGKLTTISGQIYTMYMASSAAKGLKDITDMLKSAYMLNNLEAYTKNGGLNAMANNSDESLIVADNYTIYGLFSMLKTGNFLSYVDFIFTDKYKDETGISSAAAGITPSWGISSTENATETMDTDSATEEPVFRSSIGNATTIGNCKYGTYLSIGTKANIVNVSSLQLYMKPNGNRIEGLSAWQGPELTITDGPICLDGVIWWEINFLGYIGWVPEMNASGTYYLEKR